MPNYDNIYCSQCNCKTEKALMLSCTHNLCMNCAAKYLKQKNPPILNNKQYIICELCGSKTEIDVEVSREIISSILNNLNINPNYLNANINNNNYTGFVSNQFNNNINHSYNNLLIPNSNIIKTQNLCKEHGEPISYICFDCLSQCICSECVISGIHNRHEVLSFKKAFPLIYEKIQELQKYTNEKINDLNYLKNNLNQKKINIGTINQRYKNEIRNAFQIVHIKLNDKEKEIIEKTESTLKEEFNELNTYINIIQDKMTTLNKIIDSINSNLFKKDELNLINYYCDNKNNILSQIEMNEVNSMFKINSISDLKINFNKKSFDNMLIAMNDLDFEIKRVKSIDLNNKINNKIKKNNNFDIKLSPKKEVYGIRYKNRISNENPFNLTLTSYVSNKINRTKSKNNTINRSYKDDINNKRKNKSLTKINKRYTGTKK